MAMPQNRQESRESKTSPVNVPVLAALVGTTCLPSYSLPRTDCRHSFESQKYALRYLRTMSNYSKWPSLHVGLVQLRDRLDFYSCPLLRSSLRLSCSPGSEMPQRTTLKTRTTRLWTLLRKAAMLPLWTLKHFSHALKILRRQRHPRRITWVPPERSPSSLPSLPAAPNPSIASTERR